VSPSDIERRRLAIADALRHVMADPAPVADEQFATVTPIRLLAPEPMADRAEADDDLVDERASVPPFEPAGEMSAIAAKALFGNH
jgi:hypothetical protein